MSNEPVTGERMSDQRDKRPVLVTGATGFIGLEVVRQLSAAGVPVRAMFRRRHRAALLAPMDAELVCANLLEPTTLERATSGCRAIIHLGGRATFEPYERLRPTLVDGTAHLLNAAEQAGVDRVVFGSSLFVHRSGDGPVVDAGSPTHPLLDYGRAKVDAESLLDASPVSALAIRLPHVYGWNDILFGIARFGVLPFPADLDTVFPHLHVTDAARALIAGVEIETTAAVPVADDLTTTWRHFFEVVTTYLPRLRLITLPPRPITAALGLIDHLPVQKPSMLGADTIRGWNMELRVAPGSMRALGIDPWFASVDTGIPAVLDSARPYRWRHPVFDRAGA